VVVLSQVCVVALVVPCITTLPVSIDMGGTDSSTVTVVVDSPTVWVSVPMKVSLGNERGWIVTVVLYKIVLVMC
jgi:hypothetical protein